MGKRRERRLPGSATCLSLASAAGQNDKRGKKTSNRDKFFHKKVVIFSKPFKHQKLLDFFNFAIYNRFRQEENPVLPKGTPFHQNKGGMRNIEQVSRLKAHGSIVQKARAMGAGLLRL